MSTQERKKKNHNGVGESEYTEYPESSECETVTCISEEEMRERD